MTDAPTLPQPLFRPSDIRRSGRESRRAPPLRLPSTEQGLRYALAYWSATLRSLCGGHRVQPGNAQRYRTRLHLSSALLQRWHDLFADGRGAVPKGCPLLVSQSVGTLLVARLFADLGVNLRHVLHLSHAISHPLGTAPALAATRLLLSCRLLHCVRMGADSVLLVVQTRVGDENAGRCVAVAEDGFLVRCVPTHDVAAAEADRTAMRSVLTGRRRGCAIDPEAPGAMHAHIPIAPDAAQRYGRVAGDLNPVRGGGLLGWVMGAGTPVVQGMYLRNRVVRELAAWGCALDRLTITFKNPVQVGQTLLLARLDDRFEVSTQSGVLVALGEC